MKKSTVTFPTFEEYRDMVYKECEKVYQGDKVLEYMRTDEGIDDLRHDYRGYKESFNEGFAYGKRITDPEQYIRNRVSASVYNLFMCA